MGEEEGGFAVTTATKCHMCTAQLGSGTITVSLFQGEADVAVCSSRCLVAFSLSEFEDHSNRNLKQVRKGLESARLILESGGRADAVLAEIEKVRKALWLIDHGKADKK